MLIVSSTLSLASLACNFKYIDHGEKILIECPQFKKALKATEKEGVLYDQLQKTLNSDIQGQYQAWLQNNKSEKENLRLEGENFKFKCH